MLPEPVMGLDVARLAVSCFPLLFRASPLCDRVELGSDGIGSGGGRSCSLVGGLLEGALSLRGACRCVSSRAMVTINSYDLGVKANTLQYISEPARRQDHAHHSCPASFGTLLSKAAVDSNDTLLSKAAVALFCTLLWKATVDCKHTLLSEGMRGPVGPGHRSVRRGSVLRVLPARPQTGAP